MPRHIAGRAVERVDEAVLRADVDQSIDHHWPTERAADANLLGPERRATGFGEAIDVAALRRDEDAIRHRVGFVRRPGDGEMPVLCPGIGVEAIEDAIAAARVGIELAERHWRWVTPATVVTAISAVAPGSAAACRCGLRVGSGRGRAMVRIRAVRAAGVTGGQREDDHETKTRENWAHRYPCDAHHSPSPSHTDLESIWRRSD
jgi:hypothetical protein